MTFQSCMMRTQRLEFFIQLMARGKDALGLCASASYVMLEQAGEQRPEGWLTWSLCWTNSHFHRSDSNSQICIYICLLTYIHMYIHIYILCLCVGVCPGTCVPWHLYRSQKMCFLDVNLRSSTQTLEGLGSQRTNLFPH